MSEDKDEYPYIIDCYLSHSTELNKRYEPIKTIVVSSDEDAQLAKERFNKEYPGCWCASRPFDVD